MKQPNTVSVVIPSYNYADYVALAVRSVLNQSHKPHEVIVVDDGSTDHTQEALAVFGNHIRYIYQENQGLSAARNAGVQAATGEFVALLDSDDGFHPRKLELQVEYLEKNPAVGLLGTRAYLSSIDENPQFTTPVSGTVLTKDELVIRVRFCPSSAMFRRALWPSIGPFDQSVSAAADRDFWIRAAGVTRVARLDAQLTYYRIHAQSMTRNVDMMIAHEQKVISKTFRDNSYKGRIWFRRRVEGLALASAGYMYFRDAGRSFDAFRSLFRSYVLWPVPLRSKDVQHPLWRLRLLLRVMANCLLQICKGFQFGKSKAMADTNHDS